MEVGGEKNWVEGREGNSLEIYKESVPFLSLALLKARNMGPLERIKLTINDLQA